jgi:pSer/pThr/pTyr-binding forkhead associated (FHA) protein
MSDNQHDEEPVRLPFQGPHWRKEPPEAGVVPLRLQLRPGPFSVEVTRSGVVFGRHSTADIRLPLPDVSRRHCSFICDNGRWQIVDLGSLNGIFVNDVPVRQAELHDRDTIRIGGFIFDVDLSAAATASTMNETMKRRRAS